MKFNTHTHTDNKLKTLELAHGALVPIDLSCVKFLEIYSLAFYTFTVCNMRFYHVSIQNCHTQTHNGYMYDGHRVLTNPHRDQTPNTLELN